MFKRLGPAGPLALVAASAPAIVGFAVLGSLPWIGGWLRGHPGSGAILYACVYILLGGLSCLPTWSYSALGGYAFGFERGLPLAVVSFTGAALVAYIVDRRAAGERVLKLLEEHPKLLAVQRALLGSGLLRTFLIITLLRIPPNSPFALTNLVLASTRVHPVAYILGTLIGLAPRTGAVVFLASRFGLERKDPPWLWGIWIAVTLVVLGIVGHLANQAIHRVTGARPAPSADA